MAETKLKVKSEKAKVAKPAAKKVIAEKKEVATKKVATPKVEAKKPVELAAKPVQFAVGRRKRAVARVRMYTGKGEIIINEVPVEKLITSSAKMTEFMRPIVASGMAETHMFTAKVIGGGTSGQLDAVRMGIARCIAKINEDLKRTMRQGGHLTRDPREKERKKIYHVRARKSPQYSKR